MREQASENVVLDRGVFGKVRSGSWDYWLFHQHDDGLRSAGRLSRDLFEVRGTVSGFAIALSTPKVQNRRMIPDKRYDDSLRRTLTAAGGIEDMIMVGKEASQHSGGMSQALLHFRACSKLMARGVSYRLRRMSGRPALPRSLTVTITRRCNSRCIMCNIWRLRRNHEELALDEITRFLSSPSFRDLVELDLTGGEPFLRADLPVLVDRICTLKETDLGSLKTLALATNGLVPQRIHGVVRNILFSINGRFDLALVCSLDGIGECHDAVRGVPGAYPKVRETIERLKELTTIGLPFRLGIKTTILPCNWEQIPNLMQFADEQGLFHVLSPVLFTAQRFRNLEQQPQLDLLANYSSQLIQLYSSDQLADCYYSRVVVDTLKSRGRTVLCSAGLDHFFVEGDGRIFPCPLVSIPLGDIRTTRPEELLLSDERSSAAGMAGSFDECKWCLEPGCVRFSQATEGFAFLRFIVGRRGAKRFRREYYDEGLFKYF